MSIDIRNVRDMNGLIAYFAETLNWRIDLDDFDDIEDIAYDFDAYDIGLKEEAFAKIKSLRQLPPLVDGQKWGIFCVEFDSRRFEVSALRKILSGLIPRRRNSADHAVWSQQDLLFICFWGSDNNRTIGIAHFEETNTGLPQIKMISCAPALEDFTQIKTFENRLKNLQWPMNYMDHKRWQADWSAAFTTGYKQTIHDSSTLTAQLAIEAQGIRDRILGILDVESPNGYVHLLYEKFRNTLIHDMTETQFADMYAQTVVYGLFSARCMDATQDDFSAAEAVECIPNTNPFLKSLMRECLGSENSSKLSFDELEISNVVDLLMHTKTDAIIADFNRQTGGGREDPVIHFYEEFLTAYDKMQKVQRGVYYTPQPVVNFIVRAVDTIIKKDFGLEDGLASTATKTIKVMRQSKRRVGYYYTQVEDTEEVPVIQVLDPATGTGTFIRQTILQIYENFKAKNKSLSSDELKKAWNAYVPEHLLPRINAFELMMAPYAVAHMKLAMVLRDTGYEFKSEKRLNVYLTNSLEEAGNSDGQLSLWSDPLAFESIEANKVKKNCGINIIIGNPPYSGISSNGGDWITNLIEDYKYINGKHFGERKHWLQDDYVKFIRFSEHILENSEQGILAFINNHAFIDNPTFRCMRYHLLSTFDAIYIFDLHGNVMKKEVSTTGEKDENVFDIQQGVSINIFVRNSKRKKGLAKVYYSELFGKRETKYSFLRTTDFEHMQWYELAPNEPFYFFIPRNESNRDKYEAGFSVKELMPEHTTGIVTARDSLVIDSSKNALLKKILSFVAPDKTDEDVRNEFFGNKKAGKYLPGDSRGWNLSFARQAIRNNDHLKRIKKIEYRPFDVQFIYYDPKMVDWGRDNLMCHLLAGDNFGLIIPRQAATDNWSHVQITKYMADNRVHYSNKGIPIECPLYLYSESFGKLTRRPNLNDEIVQDISQRIGMSFVRDEVQKTEHTFSPLDVLDYIYAVLYSKRYREAYLEFLKFDFPRIPYPEDDQYFLEMVSLGAKLRKIHTSEDDTISERFIYRGKDTALVSKPYFDDDTIYFNSHGDHVSGVPNSIWNMYFGGYQPLQKWLKDRRNTEIGKADIQHYMHIITALFDTSEVMEEIDRIVII